MRWNVGSEHSRNTITPVRMLLIPLALVACGSPEPATPDPVAFGPTQRAPSGSQQPGTRSLRSRLAALDRAVGRWQAASTLHAAHRSAEEARNLVVGASGPFYGDSNGDGRIAGTSAIGILPGLKGEAGLAGPDDNACVVADVLGGSWQQPAKRWSQLQSAISRWSASGNTFPSLPSHAQRVVGWASLTLKSDSLADAHGYAKHARLHVDISVRAANNCRG